MLIADPCIIQLTATYNNTPLYEKEQNEREILQCRLLEWSLILSLFQVYGLFAHESTLVWDGKTGQLIQKLAHEGGLRFKIALSCDFVALALEDRDKVKRG